LVALYDLFEGDRPDLVHYERIVAEVGAQSVLDIGCGTGTFACQLAASGFDVIGLDPAAASLEIAQSKPNADLVSWILGDATTLPKLTVDLAVMTGNVAQIFLTDRAWTETLRGVRAALAPSGHLVFEVRNPGSRGWEEWTSDQSRTILDVPGAGQVERWVKLVEVTLPRVSFRWTYRFEDGAELHSDSTLRFRSRKEVEGSLVDAGFDVTDIRDAPDRPGKEFVFIAQRVID